MKTSSQTPNAPVLVRFDTSINLPPLTARQSDLQTAIALYLRRVFGPTADLHVSLGRIGQVASNGALVATFQVTPLTSHVAPQHTLGVAA